VNHIHKVAVCSRSFSKNSVLRTDLLEKYKNVKFNETGEKLSGKALVEFLKGYDKAITGLEQIDESILKELPELKVIGKYGVGLDMIDLSAMRKYKKRLGWVGGVNRRSVSEMVISFAVTMLRHIPTAQEEVQSGTWKQHVGGLLSGRTVGIIGCGFIGKDLVKLLQPWGCSILANDILEFPDFYGLYNVIPVRLEELLQRSDIVTLHVPLDDSTRNILSSDRLGLMKKTAILINTARGGMVDEKALKIMLIEKRLAAAAFDVFNTEPPDDNELISLPNFLGTPHIGGSAEEVILAMGHTAIRGLSENFIPHKNMFQKFD